MRSKLMVKYVDKFFSNMAIQEAELAKVPGAVRPNEDSPTLQFLQGCFRRTIHIRTKIILFQ